MNKNKKTIYGYILTLLFIAYYFSCTLFYHTHKLETGNITHSHPFSNQEHSHNNNAYHAINNLSTILFIVALGILLKSFLLEKLTFIIDYNSAIKVNNYYSLYFLRGPPSVI